MRPRVPKLARFRHALSLWSGGISNHQSNRRGKSSNTQAQVARNSGEIQAGKDSRTMEACAFVLLEFYHLVRMRMLLGKFHIFFGVDLTPGYSDGGPVKFQRSSLAGLSIRSVPESYSTFPQRIPPTRTIVPLLWSGDTPPLHENLITSFIQVLQAEVPPSYFPDHARRGGKVKYSSQPEKPRLPRSL